MNTLSLLVLVFSFFVRVKTKAPLLERTLTTVFMGEKSNVTCSLPTLAQQRRCFADPGLQGVLKHAIQLAETCREIFMYEPWQCTVSKAAFKTGSREAAFLYALYMAALVYAISQACARNEFAKCHCDTGGIIVPELNPALAASLCPDNVEYGAKFMRSFVDMGKSDQHHVASKHNAMIGLQVVEDSLETNCKRLGFCNIKICVKRLKPFSAVMRLLKQLYQSAIYWDQPNTVRGKMKKRFARSLLYTDKSTPQCNTQGRVCLYSSQCAKLCCGRGFTTHSELVSFYCRCSWDKLLKLSCSVCQTQKLKFFCK